MRPHDRSNCARAGACTPCGSATKLDVAFPAPGIYMSCFSTDSGVTWFYQTVSGSSASMPVAFVGAGRVPSYAHLTPPMHAESTSALCGVGPCQLP